MTTTNLHGYLIEIELTEDALTVVPRNKVARMALLGEDHGQGDLVLARADITSVVSKEPTWATNGHLRVAANGKVYTLHFRRKHRDDMHTLLTALVS